MSGMPEFPSKEMQCIIDELGTYGRTVEQIKTLKSGKYVFHVTPAYNGNSTIEIEQNTNPEKELENAIRYIRSIPELQTIQDKKLTEKAKILSKFYQGKQVKTPDDFYTFYQSLMNLTTSNYVSKDQLEKIIKLYERKTPDDELILPQVGRYGEVDVSHIQAVPSISKKPIRKLPASSRGIKVRNDFLLDTKLQEELEKTETEDNRFLDRLIVDLAAKIVLADGLRIDQNEIERLKSEEVSNGQEKQEWFLE
jgi:hypothetical protein